MDDQAVLDLFRRQRHNFMNHLQVLYGYAQLNRIDAMGDYFNRLVQNLLQQSQFNRIVDPKLALALLKWSIAAEDESVNLKIETSPMVTALPLANDDGVAAIDQFLTNKMAEVQQRPEDQRYIHLRLDLVDGQLHIEAV